ncbi:MAG: hypothetical protein FJ104_04605, partial [Deltaproteobacteria bacterium]|nr:hypothetical protein [Deltaproteobacteria bacterium]
MVALHVVGRWCALRLLRRLRRGRVPGCCRHGDGGRAARRPASAGEPAGCHRELSWSVRVAAVSPAPGEAALRRRQRRSLAFVVGLAFGLPHGARAACGDGVLDEVAPAEEECDDGNLDPGDGCGAACRMECARVGDAATNHTCLHGSLGPFADRVASPLPGPALSDVDPSHTYYTVVLPGPVGEHRGVISFRPGSSRPYAIYLKEAYPMRVLDETGAPLPVVLEHE